jgi:hypothetical protein
MFPQVSSITAMRTLPAFIAALDRQRSLQN